jgi:hypothetical protein
MKQKFFFLACLLPVCGLLPGCETTGDPHKGGIFWSETKAQQRIANRENRLNNTEDDTADVRRSNRRLQGAAARREEALGN